MVMDVMYDDTVLKVMRIHERNSLAPDDVSAVASMDSAHMAAATPFPESDLGPFPPGLNNEVALANARAWCQARSSGAWESVWVGGGWGWVENAAAAVRIDAGDTSCQLSSVQSLAKSVAVHTQRATLTHRHTCVAISLFTCLTYTTAEFA